MSECRLVSRLNFAPKKAMQQFTSLALQNLRPMGGGALRPALSPVPEDIPSGWRPLTTLAVEGSSRMLAANGSRIGIVSRGQVAEPITLEGIPLCVAPTVDGVIVMTRRRSYRFTLDSNFRLQAILPGVASAPLLIARAAEPQEFSVAPVTLSRAYTSGEEFTAADRSRIAAAARSFYRSASQSATALWQPVIAYARGIDREGNEVFSTEPVLLSHPDGQALAPSFNLLSADSRTTAQLDIDIPCYTLELALPAGGGFAGAGVHTVEAYVSPLIHCVDIQGEITIQRPRRAGAAHFCSVAFAPSAFSPRIPGASAAMASLVAHARELCRHSQSLRVDASTAAVSLQADSIIAPDKIIARLKQIGAKAVEKVSYVEAYLSRPHAFTASSVATSSDTFVWAGLEVDRFDGWDPRAYAVKTAAKSWHAFIKIDFADGSSRVKSAEGIDNAPMAFSPVLSYPAPDAVAMTIVTMVAGQGVFSGRFALSPDVAGRRSVYVSPTLEPIVLSDVEEAYVIPTPTTRRLDFTENVAIGHADSPLSLTASCRLTSGAVNAIAPMHFGQSSWDYGRTRFYVFTTRGIHMLSCDASRRNLSLSLIDNRIVNGHWALTDTEGGLAAIASGDIVLLKGSKVSRIADIPDATSLCWVHTDHELWCVTPTAVRIICFDHAYSSYSMPLSFEAQSVAAGCLVDQATKTVYRAGHGASASTVDILWEGTVDFHRLVRGPLRLSALLSGTFTPLVITLRRLPMPGQTPATPDWQATLTGPLRAPFIARIHTLPAHAYTLTLRATATPTTLFQNITLSEKTSNF